MSDFGHLVYFSTTTIIREAREGNIDMIVSAAFIKLGIIVEEEVFTVTGQPIKRSILNA